MGRLIASRTEARAKFYTILMPDQRTKLEKLHAAAHQRMERFHGTTRSSS
jgi:Spy/CpxP family protein refolding chaperone